MKEKELSQHAKNLLKNGYTVLTLPILAQYPKPIFTTFKKLLAENEAFKEKWKIHLQKVSIKPDHGLIPPKGDMFDKKWLFMERQNLQKMLFENGVTQAEFAPYVEFFKQMDEVHGILLRTAFAIAGALDQKIPDMHLLNKIQDLSLTDTHVMRLVEYEYQKSAPRITPMASRHTDQSCLTFQWYESHRGLVLLDYGENSIRYKYRPGQVICFFGKKIVAASGNRLEPVVHWVDSSAKQDRNAGIFFVHTKEPSIEMR